MRRRAVLEISRLEPSEVAVDLVIEALGDEDWRVRKEAAAVAVGMLEHSETVPRLVDSMIQTDDVGLRNAAAEALSAAGEVAVTEIIDRMPGLDEAGRKIAVEVLGASGDPRAVDSLIGRLEDPDYNVRGTAAEWLGEQGGEKATAALLKCLEAEDLVLVLAALQSLNNSGVSIPWSLLEPLSAEPLYGADILIALGRSGAVEAAEVIGRGLTEDPAAARAMELLHSASAETAAAVEVVLEGSDAEVLEYLTETVNSGEPAEQRAAVSCLLWSRPLASMAIIADLARNESLYPLLLTELRRWGPEALTALEQMMPDLQGRQLASVIGLLSRLLDVEAGQAKTSLFATYLASDDLAVATAASGALARFGDETVVERLLELAAKPEARVRRAAGYALVEVGRRFPEEVRKKLKRVEIEGSLGIQVCRVFEIVGKPADAALLSAALSSPDPQLRAAVLGSLAAIAGASAVETIALAMTDEDIGVRMAAAATLGRIGPAAAETIVSALHSAGGPLKAALLRALGRAGHPEAPVILRGMCRESADVALAALEAIRELGLDATELQAEILSHEDSEVIKQALAVLGSSVAPSQLIKLLDHPGWDVRLAAVDRLASLKDDARVRSALEAHLKCEKDDLVVNAIERMLVVAGGAG